MIKNTNTLHQWKPQLQFCEVNPQFEPKQISWALRQRFINGLDDAGAIKKFGKKLYINEAKFADWFETRKSA